MKFLERFLVMAIILAITFFAWYVSESCLPPLLILGLAAFLWLLANPGPNVIPVGRDEENKHGQR